MKHRKAIWATAGALVVLACPLYISAISPTQLTAKAAIWTLACLTCPIALAHRHAFSLDVALFANAATYALIGALVETLRQHHQTPVPFQLHPRLNQRTFVAQSTTALTPGTGFKQFSIEVKNVYTSSPTRRAGLSGAS